jgi:hypothetical protein
LAYVYDVSEALPVTQKCRQPASEMLLLRQSVGKIHILATYLVLWVRRDSLVNVWYQRVAFRMLE